MDVIILYAFLGLGIFNFLHLTSYIVGANIYDIKQFRRAQQRPARRRRNPLVTVVVPAHNESAGIERTLNSIRRSSYKKLQILVVDDASTDDTRSHVARYIRRYPKANIHLLRKQKNVGKGRALNHAIKRRATGDLIMTLDGDSIIHKDAIKHAVVYFDNPQVIGVAANVRIMDDFSVLGLLQKFEHMIGYRSKKFYTLTNSEFIVGGVASTYRADIMKQAKLYDTDTLTEDIGLSIKLVANIGNREQRIVYAADVVAATEGVQSYRALFKQRYRWKMGMLQNLFKFKYLVGNTDKKYGRFLTLYRLPMAFMSEALLLIEPLLLLYAIYLSFLHGTPSIIVGAYLTITVYVLMTLWPDEHTSFTSKVKQSFFAPGMYFIFYIMNAVQIVAIVRCLANIKKVVNLENADGRWVSPERKGAHA